MAKKSFRKKHKPSGQTVVFFLTGCMLLFAYVAVKHYNQYNLAFAHSPTSYRLYDAQYRPMRLRIARLYMNIPIKPARIQDGHWQVFEDHVSHLVTSATPGNKGTVILYGHNKRSMLGPLQWTEIGDQITVRTIDRKDHTYIVRKILTVSANDTKILSSEDKEVLILYTCTGFADSGRFVVKAYPL